MAARSYPSYPYYQELGELVALYDLTSGMAKVLHDILQGDDVYQWALSLLAEYRRQFDAIDFSGGMTEHQRNLRDEFNRDYARAYQLIEPMSPLSRLSDKQRQALLSQRPYDVRIANTHEYFVQRAESLADRTADHRARLEDEHGE